MNANKAAKVVSAILKNLLFLLTFKEEPLFENIIQQVARQSDSSAFVHLSIIECLASSRWLYYESSSFRAWETWDFDSYLRETGSVPYQTAYYTQPYLHKNHRWQMGR